MRKTPFNMFQRLDILVGRDLGYRQITVAVELAGLSKLHVILSKGSLLKAEASGLEGMLHSFEPSPTQSTSLPRSVTSVWHALDAVQASVRQRQFRELKTWQASTQCRCARTRQCAEQSSLASPRNFREFRVRVPSASPGPRRSEWQPQKSPWTFA